MKLLQPFSWVSRHLTWFGIPLLILIAALFRFWHLATVPPGLATGEAIIGVQSLNLIQHGWLPGFTAANGWAPLWIWLQALPVMLFGHTILALRILPAVIGVAAVAMLWVWGKAWFGPRVGWIAAFLLAVTPWSVTISRNAGPVALIPLLVILTLWVGTQAYHSRKVGWLFALLGVTMINLLAGPLGWTLAALTAGIAVVYIIRHRTGFKTSYGYLGLYTSIVLLGTATILLVVTSWSALQTLPKVVAIFGSIGDLTNNLYRVIIMFNLQGDESFGHNLGSQPLLNAFVGLMFVAGILVAVSRYAKRTYILLLVAFGVLLLPAIISNAGTPNAAHAAGTLPLVMVLAAIGISYMLELWYSTFPVNSAARATGQTVVILLLVLTFFHGYTQYFRAWAGSIETYAAYNESAVASSKFLLTNKFVGSRYMVGMLSELPVPAYLVNGNPAYTPLLPAEVTNLPLSSGSKQFVVTLAGRNEAAKYLSIKFPGGVLKAHLSDFNQAELFYVYEVSK